MENIIRFVMTFVIVFIGLTFIPKIVEFIVDKIGMTIMIRRGGKTISDYEKEFIPHKNAITPKCAMEFYKFSVVCKDICENYIVNYIMANAFSSIDEYKKCNHDLSESMPSKDEYADILRMYVSICQFSAMYDPIMFDLIHRDEDEINSKPNSYKFAIAISRRYNSREFIDAVAMHFTSVIIAFQRYIRDNYSDVFAEHTELIGMFNTMDTAFENDFNANVIPDAREDFKKKLDEQEQAIILDQRYLDVFDIVFDDYIDEV